jgi:hypothetical protein
MNAVISVAAAEAPGRGIVRLRSIEPHAMRLFDRMIISRKVCNFSRSCFSPWRFPGQRDALV